MRQRFSFDVIFDEAIRDIAIADENTYNIAHGEKVFQKDQGYSKG
jgi:hypothetical protein